MKTSTELIKSIDKDFYIKFDTSKKFIKLLKHISLSVCSEYELPGIEIEMKKFPLDIRGNYISEENVIYLNSVNFEKNFEIFKENNNLFYIFDLIDTILHETRHYVQTYNENIKDIHPVVKITTDMQIASQNPRLISSINYDMSPDEVDARHFAYARLSKNPLFDQYKYDFILNEKINMENPYDFKPILKSKSKILKPFIKDLKQTLKNKPLKKFYDKDLSLYFEIAPKFKEDKDIKQTPPDAEKEINFECKVMYESALTMLNDIEKKINSLNNTYMFANKTDPKAMNPLELSAYIKYLDLQSEREELIDFIKRNKPEEIVDKTITLIDNSFMEW